MNSPKGTGLGRYLKSMRLKSGLSQGDVSLKLNLTSPQFISNIERGVSPVPIPVLKKLIVLYSIPERALMDILLTEQINFFKTQLFHKRKTL